MMKDIEDKKIAGYRNALIMNNDNLQFKYFLESLSFEELKAYLYIESKRIECFLSEIGCGFENYAVAKKNNKKINRHILKSQSSYDFLINFCNDCGKKPKPVPELIHKIFEKHKLHLRELTENEKHFFMEC
ncbi:MAG: hypothetical protein V1779_01935 [bacterium]